MEESDRVSEVLGPVEPDEFSLKVVVGGAVSHFERVDVIALHVLTHVELNAVFEGFVLLELSFDLRVFFRLFLFVKLFTEGAVLGAKLSEDFLAIQRRNFGLGSLLIS